ncbi:hypothetical protein NT6N_23060 [Oceaniferula spumae]|uniref:DUF302 domain-containing protein n=1 Tax=Oceaniferula spumae TaxID=2979115 RepID=A0AAT9FMQ4_9BACT
MPLKPPRSIMCLALALLCISSTSHAKEQALPGAKQTGPGCAFYANVPTLTRVTGVNVADGSAASKSFITRVYGLRKGDFKIRTSFDKTLFFELFGIEAKPYEKYLSGTRQSVLLQETEQIIADKIRPALIGGSHVSARVIGDIGRPHNILLVSWNEGKFRYHNPTTGRYYSSSQEQLAKKMLTKSTRKRKMARSSYYVNFLTVSVAKSPISNPLPISKLPRSLQIELTDNQSAAVQEAFLPKQKPSAEIKELDDLTAAFPKIGWVGLLKGDRRVDAIEPSLNAEQLRGITEIARLRVHCLHTRRQSLAPVLMIKNRPHLMVAYSDRPEAAFTFFDGKKMVTLSLTQTLAELKRNHARFGYIDLSGL